MAGWSLYYKSWVIRPWMVIHSPNWIVWVSYAESAPRLGLLVLVPAVYEGESEWGIRPAQWARFACSPFSIALIRCFDYCGWHIPNMCLCQDSAMDVMSRQSPGCLSKSRPFSSCLNRSILGWFHLWPHSHGANSANSANCTASIL